MAVRRRKHHKSTRNRSLVRGSSVSATTRAGRQRNRASSDLASFYVCLVLIALTWLVFGQTLWHDFVNLDDHVYVYDNPLITRGLTLGGVINAFVHTHARNWHPLTTLSHMLDCQLFGLKAGRHHFTNVLLHSVSVVLLFFLLKQMTSAFWQSAFVTALFAIHPLHVESVAWVSERKDVLSAVFFMLTLWAYVRYVQARSIGRYLTVALLLALGLMSKPMLVTVPFVLLLLDYWPLDRFSRERTRLADGDRSPHRAHSVAFLLVEKIPLFALSALSCIATSLVQLYSEGAIDQLPFVWRLNNAAVSYVAYIWQMFWPARLAVFYPHPNDQLPLWQVLLAIAFLISVSLLAIRWRKERPYVFTGWFWYVGMLVPVIGLVQAGEQARADRYTYLPQIGLYVLIAWGIIDLILSTTKRSSSSRSIATRRRPATHGSRQTRARGTVALTQIRADNPSTKHKIFCAMTAAAVMISLGWRAFVQASYWKNSETLWNHTLALTGDNDVAHNNLGNVCLQRGDLDTALWHFETALKIRARKTAAYYNFGGALIENSVAAILAKKGRINEAISHYDKAINMRPDYGDPYLNLGNLLFQQGRIGDAMSQWEKAVGTLPHDAAFHTLLGDALLRAESQKVAIAEYEHAARISAQDAMCRNNLAWLLATSSDASIRDGNRALEFAKEAVRLSRGKDPNYLRTLAAAFAESGHFAEAKETARQALQAAELGSNSTLANALRDE